MIITDAADTLIDRLTAEIETLRERNRQLESLILPDDVVIAPEWGLVNVERRCFAALTVRDVVTKQQLYAAVYGDRNEADLPAEESIVESHISKMRKKLKSFGIEVRSERFVGYSLVGRERFRRTVA